MPITGGVRSCWEHWWPYPSIEFVLARYAQPPPYFLSLSRSALTDAVP